MCLIGYPDIAHFRAHSDQKYFNQDVSKESSELDLAENYHKDMAVAEDLLSRLLTERLASYKNDKQLNS